MPKTLHQIKAYRTGYQTIPTSLKRNELSNSSRLLHVNASALITFWYYMSERILSFAYYFILMCPSVSGPKALKNVSVICHIQNTFERGWKKYGVFVQKSLSFKKYFKRKKIADTFLSSMCYYKITKIVRMLWLAERRDCVRVCNHGCDATLSVSPVHFKAVSLTLKYKY